MEFNFTKILSEHQEVLATLQGHLPLIDKVVRKLIDITLKGGKIIWMGNGGSAADAQHMAAELVGRFSQERPAIPALSLSTDSSILTSVSNDYGFNQIFARQLQGLCQARDAVVALSTSGNSENVIQGIRVARAQGAYVLGLTGFKGGRMLAEVEDCIVVDSHNTPRIQEAHSLLGHFFCESIEQAVVQNISATKLGEAVN